MEKTNHDVKNSEDKSLSNQVKDIDNWVTGDESMTGAQASYLKTLCEEANMDFDSKLSKAQASYMIEDLQKKTGRGLEKDQ